LTSESYWKYGLSISVEQLSLNALQWLRDKSLREIIDADIAFYGKHENPKKIIDVNNPMHVNDRISHVIKINSIVITHILIKYLKLLNDLLEPRLTEDSKERFRFALALPTMLELGTSEPVVINLISRGVSRSIALKVFDLFKREPNHEELNVFVWMASKDELKLKPIYNRYLKRMRLLKTVL